ncbi:MAG: hypothetical protein A3F69_06805 [Acidobacteria bacterium RIFCSPLOWO2_12_FULL_66_10]|nr:MAG: hypothetical protein A3F69_06805 [Acidobacteria bacterium RIFCSPLOWO2_12_FULL_66_10]
MMRVVFVVPSLNGGGAERAAVTVLNSLDASAHARALYLFRREGPYLRDVAEGIELTAPARDDRVTRVRRLAEFVRAWRPYVVVSFLSYFSVWLAMRLARSHARFVINQQTPLSAFLTDRDYAWRKPVRRRVFEGVARGIYPRADAVVATSQGVAEDLVEHFGVRPRAIATISNPVDLAAIARALSEPIDPPLGDGPPLIVTAGRLADAKNVPLLVDALQGLKRTRPFRALVLGTGELEGDTRRRIEAAGLQADVRLCGFQSNPWKYMARADVFVLTSRYEGFGNVLVEAMACGTPVVATASPGTRAIIEDGVNGMLVERHDADAVAVALGRVLGDAEMRARLARGARLSAAPYDAPAIGAAYARLFRQLVA